MLRIFSLVQAVGIDEQEPVFHILQAGTLEGCLFPDTQRHVVVLDGQEGAVQQRRIVTAVAEVHQTGCQVNHAEEHGHEHVLVVVAREGNVQLGSNLLRRQT